MRLSCPQMLLTLTAGAASAAAAAVEPSKTVSTSTTTTTTATTLPCTASSTSGAFYDLRPDIAVALAPGSKAKTGVQTTDYAARGYDYGANFTLNICAPVVEPVTGVMGVDRNLWGNVSAYYKVNDEIFSLGQQSTVLNSRGRELALQYSGGSPCPDLSNKSGKGYSYERTRRSMNEHSASSSSSSSSGSSTVIRRKSATFAFLCDRDPVDSLAHISYVGAVDECAYFFKIRSQHACAGAEPHKPGSVGPGGVFAIILGVALMVYFIGGVVYQRTVAHARGWRQLPNYTIWVGIWTFFRDIFVILTSSCLRFLPYRRGYRSLSTSPNGRSRSRDDENRLIDQLDEEWDD